MWLSSKVITKKCIFKEATLIELCLKMLHFQKQPYQQLQCFGKKIANKF